MQAAVDDKHKLVVATHVINKNDRNALHDIASEAKENLHSDGFTVLADKGYHNGRELQDCQNNGIQTIVAPSEIVNSNKIWNNRRVVYSGDTGPLIPEYSGPLFTGIIGPLSYCN